MNLPEQNDPPFIGEFLELQRTELITKQQELEVRRAEIESNERIALKSIEAQQADNLKRGDVFLSIQKGRLWLFIGIVVLLTAIIIVSMITNHITIALELIKIGGAVLLGYFAGLHKGKSQVLENQQRQNDD